MKLTQVSIQNGMGETLNLPLHSYANGFLVKDIAGLDPVAASLVSTTVARLDGAQFQAARRETRNIVLTLGLEPDYTIHSSVGELRRVLYNYAMPETEVLLTFDMDGQPHATMSVRVESLETSLFTASPEVQISFVGYDPDFVGTDLIIGNDLETGTTISYNGTVPTGLDLFYNVWSLTDPWIEIVGASGTARRLRFQGTFTNVVIGINTRPGHKSVRNLGGAPGSDSLLYAVPRNALWPLLEPGDNLLSFAQGTGTTLGYSAELRYGGL